MDGTLLDERGEWNLPSAWKGSWTTWIKEGFALSLRRREMKSIDAPALGPLVKRGDSVVANGARIFEDDQMILGKFWDRELVEAGFLLF